MDPFANLLREKRRSAGISQRQLAEKAGVDFSYISKLENGRLPPPSAETVQRIATILGCAIEELLAAARKMPAGVNDTLTAPAALRFLTEANRLRPSAEEWDALLGKLHGLRSEPGEERDT